MDVLRGYGNRTSVLADLRRAAERLKTPHLDGLVPDQGPNDLASASPLQGARLISVRFTPEQVATIVERFKTGATIYQVAAEYQIGTTTLKGLLRKYKARRKDAGR